MPVISTGKNTKRKKLSFQSNQFVLLHGAAGAIAVGAVIAQPIDDI
jgi:hypothetical protein